MAALSSIAIGAIAVGTAASTYTNYRAQRSAANAAESEAAHRARIAGINADLADAQAADASVRGEQEAARFRGQVRSLVGSQRAGLAAQGIEVNDGSAAAVQDEAVRLGAEDEATLRNNARREAWGFKVDAYNLRQTGDLTLAAGRNQAAALRTARFGTLLTGASNLASIGYSAGWFSRGGGGVKVPQGTTAPSSYRG